jgi:GNAT superfamily N-acetyltransferase
MAELVDLTAAPGRFFDILPDDWRVEIEPFWLEYRETSWIYGLDEGGKIIAGGIVFSGVSPDTKGYYETAQQWLDKGYLYMGFIYVDEDRRGEGLGSLWVNKVKEHNPKQKYWLAIDEYGLSKFYQKLGFRIVEEVRNGADPEWVLVEE